MRTIAIEIPVISLERAKRFYEAVFAHDPTEMLEVESRRITLIPGDPLVILNETAGFTPSPLGSLPYFTVDGTIGDVLARVVALGGAILGEVAPRGGGDVVVIADSEGNALTIKAPAS